MEYKGYIITTNAGYSLTKVGHKGAGKIPDALSGWYTNPKEAKAGVDMYLNSLKKGRTKNGKKDSNTAD